MHKKLATKYGLACLVVFALQNALRGADNIEFVVVGHPGNQHFPFSFYYPATALQLKSWPDMGGIPYTYRISKYEITRGQWLEFLNTVDPNGELDPLGANVKRLFPKDGFTFDSGLPEGEKYELDAEEGEEPDPRLPVAVFYAGAARFCNWLHFGKGGPDTTEGTDTEGAYDTRNFDDGDPTNDPDSHNPGATFWIPSESEWVKAAYYDAEKKDYWRFPTRSNTEPRGECPPGGANSINAYDRIHGIPRENSPGVLLPVGSYTQAPGPYGTFDMGGNLGEWTESWFDPDEFMYCEIVAPRTCRRDRAGGFMGFTDHAGLFYRWPTHAALVEEVNLGLRIAASVDQGAQPDADSDGLPDWWEELYFGGATNAKPDTLAANETYTLLEAYVAGLNPHDPLSSFKIADIEVGPDGARLKFDTVLNRVYSIDFCTNLNQDTEWVTLTNDISGNNSLAVYLDLSTNISIRFYRLRIRR